MESLGIKCEFHHHEVSSGGQGEIDMRFQPLLRMADQMMIYKYVVKNEARRAGKTATFMPKPIFEENGSGMHVHQSLWKDGDPLNVRGGRLRPPVAARAPLHSAACSPTRAALLAFCAPTTNSYRRLVPGYEAPVNLVFSARNRSAAYACRCTTSRPRASGSSSRSPDPTANPYLAFSALMLAGLDGIKRGLDPAEPLDADIYELPPDRLASIGTVPSSLEASLDALESDHQFLLEGDVFTPGLIGAYIRYKREEEVDAIRMRPHPWEFALYPRRLTAGPATCTHRYGAGARLGTGYCASVCRWLTARLSNQPCGGVIRSDSRHRALSSSCSSGANHLHTLAQ